MKAIEKRVTAAPVEVRAAEGQASTVRGYAALYNTEAVIGGVFREMVAPGAFRSVLAASPDVRALFNHDDNLVLARTTNGTLTLFEDERGLGYEFTPNAADSDAMNVLARIQRGDVNQSSYGFAIAEGGDSWQKPASRNDLPLRTITQFALLRDVSPVTFPAFEATTAEARSAARAAQAMSPGDAEEAGEAIQFDALQALLEDVTAQVAKIVPLVDALAAENGPADDSDEAEQAEETVERARYAVLRAHAAQLCGAASAVQALVGNLAYGGYGYYSASHLTTLRAQVDVMAVDI